MPNLLTADDNEVMREIQAGDIAKLSVLYERYHRKIHAYFFRVCGDQALSEDLVQNVFMRIMKYRESFRGDNKFLHWIFRIARNTWIDHYRQNSRHSSMPLEMATSPIETENAHSKLERSERHGLLHRALGRLSPEKREAIVLSRFEEMKYKEIAQLMDTSENNIKTRVRRGLIELKKIIVELQEKEI